MCQIAINSDGSEPSSSAFVDIASSGKGILIPRLTEAQKSAISSPAVGLLVYVTDASPIGFSYYTGSEWKQIKSEGSSLGIYAGDGTAASGVEVSITDTLNFGSGTLLIESATNEVGFGRTNPAYHLDVQEQINIQAGGTILQGEIYQYVFSTLSVSTTPKRFEIARSIVDGVNETECGAIIVELFERNYGGGGYKKYLVEHGYPSSSSRLTLMECIHNSANTNEFQVQIGSTTTISGDHEYLPIYVDLENDAHVDVRITTNRAESSAPPHSIPSDEGKIYIDRSPSGTTISAFTADYIVQNRSGMSIRGHVRPETDNVYDLGTSSYRWDDVYATNGTINTSDARLKKNIRSMSYGLEEVKQLNPVSFNWKNEPSQDKIGFIAQDLETLVPEVVNIGSDSAKTLGVNYAELVSVLTKSIQELKSKNLELTKRAELIKCQLK